MARITAAATLFGAEQDRDRRLIYAVAAGRGGIFILPVLVVYFDEHIGLSFAEFLYSEAVYATVLIAMEVPSGWFADRTRRKTALAIGALVAMAGFGLLWQADGLAGAMLAQAVIGIGLSLVSGADTALLYEVLATQGRSDEFRRAEGMRHAVWLYATAVSGIAGGLAYAVSSDLPFLLTISVSLLTAAAAMLVREPARRRAPRGERLDWPRVRVHLRSADTRAVVRLVAFVSLTFAGTNVVFWLQQPYWQQAGMPVAWFGLLAAAGLVMAGLAGQHGHWLEAQMGRRRTLAALPLVLAAIVGLAGAATGFAGIAVLLLSSAVWGYGWPAVQAAMNARIGEERRATILSLANMALKLAFIPLSALMGLLEARAGAAGALIGLAALLAFAWIVPGSPLRKPEA